MAEQTEIQKLAELMDGARSAVMVTHDSDGELVARPMALQQIEFDGDLWFFTSKSSPKVGQITQNPQVNVSFQNGSNWVSIAGTAEQVDDKSKAEELWSPFVKAYFPGGLEDPELTLIKVHANGAEYWDADNKVVSLFKMAKAAATDTIPDMGENKTLHL